MAQNLLHRWIVALSGARNPHVLCVHSGSCAPFVSLSKLSRRFFKTPIRFLYRLKMSIVSGCKHFLILNKNPHFLERPFGFSCFFNRTYNNSSTAHACSQATFFRQFNSSTGCQPLHLLPDAKKYYLDFLLIVFIITEHFNCSQP